MAKHHPHETVLTEYAAGGAAEPVALMMACHMTFCRQCRDTVELLDDVGGMLLEQALPDYQDVEYAGDFSGAVAAKPTGITLPASLLAKLDDPGEPIYNDQSTAGAPDFPDVVMPRPLREYVGAPIDQLTWRRITPSLDIIDILEDTPGYSTRLMRIAAGAAMPRHTHDGDEFTLILQGGMSDENGEYFRGDVAVGDVVSEHRPVALEGDDCVCLAVNQAQVRLTGPIGRWLNPFVNF